MNSNPLANLPQEPGSGWSGSLREKAYSYIRRAILDGKLAPGQPLPVQDLATELRISRTPVREALAILHSEMLVEVFPSRGTFVARLSIQDVRHLFELREALEGIAARLAARRRTATDLDRLYALADRLASTPSEERVESAAEGAHFHMAIAEIGGNPRISRALEEIAQQTIRLMVIGHRIPGRSDEACEEHRQVLEAIGEGDEELAEQKMRAHLRISLKNALKIV